MRDQSGNPASERGTLVRHRDDIRALAAFLAVLALVYVLRVADGLWLAEYDILSYFLPWYGYLGDRLRAFDLPGWMPWLSSGSPFAGDPSGGWWYLPAMVAFALFDVITAFKVMVVIQTSIAGGAAYAFGRLVGMGPLAGLMTALTYAFGPMLASQLTYGTVAGQASTWVPVALVGIEGSLRSTRLVPRAGWWALAGFAISQIATSWPGQGLYNALLLIAGWVAYRTLFWPVQLSRPIRSRLIDAMTTGPAILVVGMLLGAAGFLPRLSISAVSTIPNGDYSGVVGGDYLVRPHTIASLLRDTFLADMQFRPVAIAAPVAILAITAVVVGRRRFGIPYFAALTIVAGILTLDNTPLHEAFYLMPRFEDLHSHSPRRILWVCFIAPAVLSGAGVESLLRWRPRARGLVLLGVPPLVMGAVAWTLHRAGMWVGWWPIVLAVATTALSVGIVVSRMKARGRILRPVIVLCIMTMTVSYALGSRSFDPAPGIDWSRAHVEDCLATYASGTDPGGAGEFLHERQAAGEIFRYVGYAGRDPASDDSSYNYRRCDPGVPPALVGGRPALLGLESIQGYNPLHLGYYAEYIDVMNGGPQNYHWVDPYPAALASSPLLDMLNVRFIVVGLGGEEDPSTVSAIRQGRTEVFRNDDVVVYENPAAFPRAWIVHDVRLSPGDEGLRQLEQGEVDGRQVAFIDGPVPEVDTLPPGSAGAESVEIVSRGHDEMTAEVRAEAAGLVIFSEVYEEGWKAFVDGEEVEIVRTNHALRGVPVPAGEHLVEFRYEPVALTAGLWVSGLTAAATAGLWGASFWQWRKNEPDSQSIDSAPEVRASNPIPAAEPD